MAKPESLEHEEVEVPPALAAQFQTRCGPDPSEISAAMGPAFRTLKGFIEQHRLTPAPPPRAIYSAHGPEGTEFTVAMPIAPPAPASAPATGAPEGGSASIGTLPGARALRFLHRGPYRDMTATYQKITQFMQERGMLQSEADWANYMPMWEEYMNDPRSTPEEELITNIYLPVR